MNLAESENREPAKDQLRQRSRIRRAKQFLRPLPRRATLHRYPFIKWFADTARKKPHLWSFRIAQASPAIYIGCILAFLPAYGIQLPLAFVAALIFRANLLITVALQFITNPLTIIPVYWFTHLVGQRLIEWWNLGEFDSFIGSKAYALVVGGLIVGLTTALALDIAYRLAAARARTRSLDVKRMLKR